MSHADLENRLGHTFTRPELLQEALTHSSFTHERREAAAGVDNQRLEFLGDAVLQLAISERLFVLFPDWPEGRLTQLRASLVNRIQLHKTAAPLGLGEKLTLGRGEEANGGRTRPSNLADALEAIIGAIFLDAGWVGARDFVLRAWEIPLAEASAAAGIVSPPGSAHNPKGDLQERLQASGNAPPEYTCLSQSGPAHARVYETAVIWQGKELARGTGSSKKEAETRAAQAALLAPLPTPPSPRAG